MEAEQRYSVTVLNTFARQALEKMDVPAEEAQITADVLNYADLRGIDSHGTTLLPWYVGSIGKGAYRARRTISVVHETPSTALVDGGNGLGQPAAARAMEIAIQKGAAVGSSCVAVRHSSHFGAAGYYAAMALAHDMIGLCLTNAGPAVLPTFGLQPQSGTNPIALAVPANKEPPFVLDMATSVKAAGKLKVLARAGKSVPDGWLLEEDGSMSHDPEFFVRERSSVMLGGLLPLGGTGEELSGYKGYGLGLGVDLLTGVLAGDTPSSFMKILPGYPEPSVSHFFAAIRIDAFRPAAEFKDEVDRLLAHIKASPKLPGHQRIFVAGEKELECLQERRSKGVPLPAPLVDDLKRLAGELDLPFPEPRES
jgi:LDH2 family malate/lactate/ureidoglycolate dehydrogenase